MEIMSGTTTEVNQKEANGTREEYQDEEAYVNCSVDSCRQNTPLSMVNFLPQDDILKGIEMILWCKSSIRVQNCLMQRYLEAHHLASRDEERGKRTDWCSEIPFRICYRHFSSNGKLMPLPKMVNNQLSSVLEFKRRESLFYMYGVGKKVEFPSDCGVDLTSNAKVEPSICDIPGCDTSSTTDAAKFSNLRLFPNPIHMSLRHEWERAIGRSLGHNFMLKNTGFVCEKHFPNKGKIVNGAMELPVLLDHSLRTLALKRNTQKRMATSQSTIYCMVRCCPITSNSIKRDRSAYKLFQLPSGAQGEKWMNVLRQADQLFIPRSDRVPFVCERHFATNPTEYRSVLPLLSLDPSEAAMNRMEKNIDSHHSEETCSCCRDVEMCYEILRRFNSKMNTMMQHVNMLCVLEGVKEVIPRPFNDTEDDASLYGDSDRMRVMAGVGAASMFVREARGEVSMMKRALDTMRPSTSRCALPSCRKLSVKMYKMVNWNNFENDLKRGTLMIRKDDLSEVRRLFAKGTPVNLCESHWRDKEMDKVSHGFESDNEEVRRLKETLALPLDFQPKYGKRRRMDGIEKEAEEGGSGMVQVEVNDDEEEDERILSNNELLQRLLGGAIAGQVTGEISGNGEVYDGGEQTGIDEEQTTEDDEDEKKKDTKNQR